MTGEKAIETLSVIKAYEIDNSIRGAEDREAIDMAIKALEQEPCEDAISRQDMLDVIGHGTTYTSEELQKIIKALPPVTPQKKIGRWIDGENTKWKCSGCGYAVLDWNTTPYCPNCGAKMQEVKE